MTIPIIARAEGMSLANGDTDRRIVQGSFGLKRVYFKSVAFDTPASKLFVLNTGSSQPSGVIRTHMPGYYRFNVSLGLAATEAYNFSWYLYLRDLGSDGLSQALIDFNNSPVEGGEHPTIKLNRTVRVDTNDRYFDTCTYFLGSDGTNPTDIMLGDFAHQTFCEVEYLGGLS